MKAVIPAAGLGTRLLPATKAQPKEMLPIVDKPAIQYVVEEAVKSGLEDILIITARGKHAIENHFDKPHHLESHLKSPEEHEGLKSEANNANIYYVRQKEQKGLGDAVLYAKPYIRDEYFAVMLGDDVMVSKESCISQLLKVHKKYNAPVVGVEHVPMDIISRYGVIAGKEVEKGVYLVEKMFEKPSKEEAPSDLAIIGRYVLPPKVFEHLSNATRTKNNELQLTDSLDKLAQEGPFYAVVYDGARYDIGDKFGLLRAGIELGLLDKDIGGKVKDYLRTLNIK